MGQEGLRRALALLGTRLSRAAVGKAKDDATLALARAYQSLAKERPGLYPATLRAPDPGDDDRRARGEEILAILSTVLQAYGLRDEAAVDALRGLRNVLHGFVSLELLGGFALPLDVDERFVRLVRMYSAGLPGLARA